MESIQTQSRRGQVVRNVWRPAAGGSIYAGVQSVGTSDAAIVPRDNTLRNMPQNSDIRSSQVSSRFKGGSMIMKNGKSFEESGCRLHNPIQSHSPRPGRQTKSLKIGNPCCMTPCELRWYC